jgi:hypothetical protein
LQHLRPLLRDRARHRALQATALRRRLSRTRRLATPLDPCRPDASLSTPCNPCLVHPALSFPSVNQCITRLDEGNSGTQKAVERFSKF